MQPRPAASSAEHADAGNLEALATDDPPLAIPISRSEERQRIAAALLGASAAVIVLVAAAAAWVQPAHAPAVLAVGAALAGLALYGATQGQLRRATIERNRLAAENLRLAQRLEALADLAWELRESEERYRSLIDAHGDLVVRRDADGAVTFVNPAFVTAFERASAAWIGKPLALAPPLAPIAADSRSVAPTRDVRLDTSAGRRWYAWVDIRMRDEIYSVARDVTERKDVERALVEARQKAETANQAKSRLLATVSHEFRTPLNGIIGMTGLLAESELTPDQATYVRSVHSSGEALLALVDDMLDFSKIEAGRLDLRSEPTDLEALVQDIAELLAARAHGKGIDIAVEIGRNAPTLVMADSARLRQVLINLAGNGVKFTERGGVTLSIHRAATGGVAFAVSDTGPGVNPEDAERMFGEFEQAETAPSRRHGGAGLGLAISRRLVRRMGGEIVLGPRPGGGSILTFVLDLPEKGIAEAVALPAAPRVLLLAPDGAEPPIAARYLNESGATARVARTPAEAAGLAGAASAAGEHHEVLLIDARAAPDPVAVLSLLREAAGRRVPAAILVDPGRRNEVETFRNGGFDAYLVRPLRRSSLLRVVAALATDDGDGFHVDPGDIRMPPPQPKRRRTAGMEVLLAEDNEINALLARAVLEGMGHTVTEVSDGKAAVAAVRDRMDGFGVILMDLHMPGLDGLSAAEAIRSHEAIVGLERSAILAVTADVLPETRAAALAAGIDGVLEKPLTPERLRRALAELLGDQN